MNSFFKRATPHLIAAGIFLLIAIVYCQPALQGKKMSQHDVVGYVGMKQQSQEFYEKYGHYPLWTNSLFSGMPAYSVIFQAKNTAITLNYVSAIMTLGLPKPINYFFLACICFYFFCMVVGMRSWLGVLAAIAFAYSTYDTVILFAGHESKMQALAFMPAAVASVLLLFRRKWLWGTALLTFAFAFQVESQHMQIIYYTLLTLGFLTLAQLIKSYKEGTLVNTFKAIGLALVAGVIGIAAYAESILPLREYAKETMRGGRSELTKADAKNASEGGLDKEYAFRWSYGIGETFTLIAPGVYGGSNGGREHTGSTEFTEAMSQLGVPEENALQMVNGYSYWGDQPNTSGPVYLGAVVCFLFIFALVFLRSWHKWWVIPAVILAIILSWGRHLEVVNYFLFDYLPFYNKFRAPSMSLVIPQLLAPMLGALAIDQLIDTQLPRTEVFKKFKLSVYITAGILALLILFYFSADFQGPNDARIRESYTNNILMQMSRGQQPTPEMQQQANSLGQSITKGLQEDRQSLFTRDLVRSIVLIALSVLLVGAYIKNKIKAMPLMIGLLLLSSFDLLAVGRRYINNDRFVDPEEFEQSFTATEADRSILADPNKPFRVFDQTDEENGPFNSSRASYFHNSVGGYHAAKLGLYQDLIEQQIANGNMEVFNMLNTKYFIVNNPANRQPVVQVNPNAFGPAWMVKHVHFVKTADDEMRSLDSLSLRDTAVVQEKFRSTVKFMPQFDSSASISIVDYLNDKISYKFSARTNQFVVFSEVYYPHGWNVFIDGNKAEYVKVNYVLRGMAVPAGEHTIEFRFEPASYNTGNQIRVFAIIIAYLLLAAAIFFAVRNRKPAVADTSGPAVANTSKKSERKTP